MVRDVARTILEKEPNLFKILQDLDTTKEGIVGRDEVHQALSHSKNLNLSNEEISLVLRFGDKLNRGYINPGCFYEALTSVA